MEHRKVAFKFLNLIFWIVILIILFSRVYYLFEPKIVKYYNDNNVIFDEKILNELADCTTIYMNKIINKQYFKANNLNMLLNRKTDVEFDNIYDKIKTYKNYKIIIKEIYKLRDETYRCYFIIQDRDNPDINYLSKLDKSTMNCIVINLDTNNFKFKVLYDVFI